MGFINQVTFVEACWDFLEAYELLSYLALSYLEYELLSTVGEGTGVLIYQIWLRAIP